MNKYAAVFYNTNFGTGVLIFSTRGLGEVILPQEENDLKKYLFKNYKNVNIKKNNILSAPLENYFKGKKIKFTYKLDLLQLSDFTKKVLLQTKKIPYGKTVSYKDIALKIGTVGYRAVGQALNKNPLPIVIPCHRVIAHNGSLGGFGAGLQWKKILLEIESIQLKKIPKLISSTIVINKNGSLIISNYNKEMKMITQIKDTDYT